MDILDGRGTVMITPPVPWSMYTICDLRRNNLHLSVIFFSHTLILLDQMSGVDRILNP